MHRAEKTIGDDGGLFDFIGLRRERILTRFIQQDGEPIKSSARMEPIRSGSAGLARSQRLNDASVYGERRVLGGRKRCSNPFDPLAREICSKLMKID
jgi:hypothetical protein